MKKVKCPRCKKLAEYSERNIYRPFCSERCRLIDLGQWADGNYTIPVQSQFNETLWNPDLEPENSDPSSDDEQ